jgi:hypothetical protein
MPGSLLISGVRADLKIRSYVEVVMSGTRTWELASRAGTAATGAHFGDDGEPFFVADEFAA